MNKIYAVIYICWEDYDVRGLFTDYETAKKEYDKLKNIETKTYQDEYNTDNGIYCLNSSKNDWYVYEVPINKVFKIYKEYFEEYNKELFGELE